MARSAWSSALPLALCVACTDERPPPLDEGPFGFGGTGAGGTGGDECGQPRDGGGGLIIETDAGTASFPDPATCFEATLFRSYVGCEFWPTVTYNVVWDVFDFAAIVANVGSATADITVERDGAVVATATVPGGGLRKVHLPWVAELKGPQSDECGTASTNHQSVLARKGAYRLTSTVPVIAYQFNALEYRGVGGPPDKDWDSCPGLQMCDPIMQAVGCFSFSNDASLLLPTPALTGSYRVTGQPGWTEANMGPFLAITATADGTTVDLKMSSTGRVDPNGAIPGAGPGDVATYQLDAGDVLQLAGRPDADLSGSLVQASHPVQVVSGMPCTQAPFGYQACDHVEEVVFPAETLGRRYFVAPPTGPFGEGVGHIVRFYGNRDGTTLTYPGDRPVGAPDRIEAGERVDLMVIEHSFEVVASHEIAVATFMLGAERVDPTNGGSGDPSQSLVTSVEQYRTRYVFLAPDDYDSSYLDVVGPMGAELELDGAKVAVAEEPIACSGFGVRRIRLGPGRGGAHRLDATRPVAIQVIGYGAYTSYQYPGGLNLVAIAPPPPPVK